MPEAMAEHLLAEVQRLSEVGCWWRDEAAGRIYWTDGLVDLLGFDPRDPDGTVPLGAARDLLIPADRERYDRMWARATSANPDVRDVFVLQRPQGGSRFLEIVGRVMWDAGGVEIGRVGVVRDVTELRRAEDGRAAAQEALLIAKASLERQVDQRTRDLAASEERYRQIAAASADWFWELDADYRFVNIDPSFMEATGHSESDLLGVALLDRALPAEPGFEHADDWEKLTETLKAREPVRDIELLRDYPKGRMVIRLNALPYWGEDGSFKGYRGVSTNLTDLHAARTRLHEAERMAQLGRMVASISHEINTPLGSGVMVASTLADEVARLDRQFKEGELTEEAFTAFVATASEAADLLQRNLRRAADLIRSFKTVAVDQTSDAQRRFTVLSTISENVATLSPQFKNAPVRISVSGDATVTVDGNPGRFGQVIQNLIQNAMLHGFAEGRDGQIEISVSADAPGWVRVEVADNGRGMEPEIRDRIFEPFFTTRSGTGGSGLGLRIVSEIVRDALGGRIDVVSAPGQGTRFVIDLPVSGDRDSEVIYDSTIT